jgi:ribonuclease HI
VTPVDVTVRVDGASRGNPGPSGAGAVVEFGDGRASKELCSYLGETTNNVAEYRALLLALDEAARHAVSSLTVHSDSELLVRQLRRSTCGRSTPRRAAGCVFSRWFVYCTYGARRTGGRIAWRTSRSINTGRDKASEEARWPPVPAPIGRGREESPGSAGQGAG